MKEKETLVLEREKRIQYVLIWVTCMDETVVLVNYS